MARKKFIVRNQLKKKMYFTIFFVLLISISIGFSTLSTNLSISGILDISKASCQVNSKLYNVLKCAAEEGVYAKEYTESHQDSMDASKSTEKIYHWYGSNNTNGTAILNKNNVIFAGQCWQMIRTTDTGGVKMIYNGEVVDGKCLSTRGTHSGYTTRSSYSYALNSNYWYGTDYTYDSVSKTFKISGTTEQTTWNETTGPGLIGKYTCKSTSIDETCSTLYLVESYYNATSAYLIALNSYSSYSQFGDLQFNVNYDSPADVGYMYNIRYTSNFKLMTNSETMLSRATISTNYWYADSISWGVSTANRYNLVDAYKVSATSDYPNLVGKYTFHNTTETYTDTTVRYIVAVNDTTSYYISLGNEAETTHDLDYYNYTYTYGDSFTDNGNGTYTINNPITINRSDWYTSYGSVMNKYVCKNAVNDTCSDLWYTTATYTTDMTYIKVSDKYKYAKGFEYKLDEEDGTYKYFLNDDSVTFFEWNDTNKTNINNAHYTCWNTTGECTTISYIYYIHGIMPYYINISNGKSVEDAKNEMLYSDNVNTTNSTIKSGVDAWYKHTMLDYDDYVEDIIFCNDRSQNNASTNGWNPDGGMANTYLQFKEYNDASYLSCTNDTDKFSITNNKAKLTYKVGLMGYLEMYLLNNDNARVTGNNYWLFSPRYFSNNVALGGLVIVPGNMNEFNISVACGVRPAVSLVPGIEFRDGDGSRESPYIVKTN